MRSALPKFPTLQKPVLIPMRARNGCSTPAVRHFTCNSARWSCISAAMRRQAFASSASPLLSGSPKKIRMASPTNFVDRAAVFERNVRHLGKILIEQKRELFRLQAFRGGGKILDVGKEDCELLALGMDRHVLLAA